MARFPKAEPKVECTCVMVRSLIVVVFAVCTLVTGCEKDKDEQSVSTTTKQETAAVKPESVPATQQNENTVSTTAKQDAVAAKPDPAPTSKEITIPLMGEIGSSPRWGSGWIDLEAPTDFLKGDRIRIKVGGSATKVLVRLLSRGQSPDTSAGRIGGTITVPEDRIIEVTLKYDRKEIIQVSVHGNPNPWNIPLGGGNGPATIEEAEIIRIVTQ